MSLIIVTKKNARLEIFDSSMTATVSAFKPSTLAVFGGSTNGFNIEICDEDTVAVDEGVFADGGELVDLCPP